MSEAIVGLIMTVAFLSLLFYLALSNNEAEQFEDVLGKSEHAPELEHARRVVWEGEVGRFPIRIFRGNQFSYDDLSLLLKTATDHDYFLRIDPDNMLRRSYRRVIEVLFRNHTEVHTEGPLSDYMVHTDDPQQTREAISNWMDETAADTLSHFHHITFQSNGIVTARWYPGYPVNDAVEKECRAFADLLNQMGTIPNELPDEDPNAIQSFS